MIASPNKISIRQAVILFIMATMSPAIRLFPQFTAKMAGKAGWLAPIVAIIPMILLVFILNSFFKKNKDGNLSDVYIKILGKVIGKIVISLYLIWVLILLAIYVRYYSERIQSSMMPDISTAFLIIVMLCLVFFATKCGLTTIARATEIFFFICLFVFMASFVFAFPQIKYRNIMKVSYKDAWPIVKSSFDLFAVWGYFLFIFFFGDKINNKENIKRFGFRGLTYIFILCLMLLIMTIGSLGATLVSHVSLPYFMTVKNISIFNTIEHVESVILSVWVIADFVIISVFTIIATSLMKSTFKLSVSKPFISPILLFALTGGLFLFGNRFDLESFSDFIALPGNILFAFIIPLIVFGIGKIRKLC